MVRTHQDHGRPSPDVYRLPLHPGGGADPAEDPGVSRLFTPTGEWYVWLEFEVSGMARSGVWSGIDLSYATQDLMAAKLTDKEAADILAASEGAAGYSSVRQFVTDVLGRRK